MIPSDHFVRFYNEVFKFLDTRNGLPAYFEAISRKQERFCLKLFQEKGLKGCDEYWGRIKHEENVVNEGYSTEDVRYGHNIVCPSLTKIRDNDAGPFERYCDHCPGWVMPLLTKSGLYGVFDTMDYDKPECRSVITTSLAKAREIYRKWRAESPNAHLSKNFSLENEA